jgi:hypothetical protein
MPGEWYEALPAELMVENGAEKTSYRDLPFVKESPDLGHFVHKALENHKELGSRIPLRVTKPEEVEAWRKEHLPKLYTAGILEKPPGSPDEYEIKRPDNIPEGLNWNEEGIKSLKEILHKHGVPKAAAADLVGLHNSIIGNVQEVFKTSREEGINKLKAEFGPDYDKKMDQASRLTGLIFKDAAEIDMLEKAGIANHPAFIGVLMRLATFAEQDSSFMQEMGRAGSNISGDQVRAEIADIMSNPNNARHKLYHSRDAATMEYIDGLYKKAYGTGQVTLG